MLEAIDQAVIHAIASSHRNKKFSNDIQTALPDQLNKMVKQFQKQKTQRDQEYGKNVKMLISGGSQAPYFTREDFLDPQADARLTPDEQVAIRFKHSIRQNPLGTILNPPTLEEIAAEINRHRQHQDKTGIGMARAKQILDKAERKIADAYKKRGIFLLRQNPELAGRMREDEKPKATPAEFEGVHPLYGTRPAKICNQLTRNTGYGQEGRDGLLDKIHKYGPSSFKNIGPRTAPHFEIEAFYQARQKYPQFHELTEYSQKLIREIYGSGSDDETAHQNAIQNHEFHFRKIRPLPR